MNFKGMNVLEQHVEKIVLAVAAGGALYLGYLAMQPVLIPDTDVPVGEVEARLSRQIQDLQASAQKNNGVMLTVNKPQFAADYGNVVQREPLSPSLLPPQARMPGFGPVNLAVNAAPVGGTGGPEPTYVVDAPAPASPEAITAEAWQQSVANVAPGSIPPAAAGGAAAAPLPTRDQNAVIIQGYIPVAQMLTFMVGKKDKLPLPASLQRVSIYRIEVQRRQLQATAWSDWAAVAPTKASPAPTEVSWQTIGDSPNDVARQMNLVDAEFKQIVVPDFYLNDQGVAIKASNLTAPPPSDIADRARKLQSDLDDARKAAAAAPAGPAAMAVGDVGGEAPAALPTEIQALKNQALVPFNFWDDTVEPDHTYQYQVRVVYVNPVFNWQQGLKNPAQKTEPTLKSAWVKVMAPNGAPALVFVPPDIQFFVMGPGMQHRAAPGAPAVNIPVQVWVYKRTGGKWYRGEVDSQAGMGIAGPINLLDHQPRVDMDVDTGYTVVDVVPGANGNDAHVVLLDPSGKLVTRDSFEDRNSQANKNLLAIAIKPVQPAPSTAPSTPGRSPTTPGRGPTPIQRPPGTRVLPGTEG